MTASELLSQALLDLADRGQRLPCTGDDRFTSDLADERADAAQLCNGCSIIAACEAAADEADEKWGVWAGIDRSPSKPGRTQKETAA